MKSFKQYLLQEDQSLKQIQNTLIDKGYDLGPTKDDGVWGKFTAAAMAAAATSAPAASGAASSSTPAAQPAATSATPASTPAAQPAAAKATGTKGWDDKSERVFVSYKTDPSFIPDPDRSEAQNQIRWEGQQKARSGFGVNSTYRNYDSSKTPEMNARYEYASKMARQGFEPDSEPNGAPMATPAEQARVDTMADAFGGKPNPNQAELNRQAFTNESAELTAMLRIAGLR